MLNAWHLAHHDHPELPPSSLSHFQWQCRRPGICRKFLQSYFHDLFLWVISCKSSNVGGRKAWFSLFFPWFWKVQTLAWHIWVLNTRWHCSWQKGPTNDRCQTQATLDSGKWGKSHGNSLWGWDSYVTPRALWCYIPGHVWFAEKNSRKTLPSRNAMTTKYDTTMQVNLLLSLLLHRFADSFSMSHRSPLPMWKWCWWRHQLVSQAMETFPSKGPFAKRNTLHFQNFSVL